MEALKFVTLNPALQLGIDDRVGSLEVGKDADFVLWSESPLSSYSRRLQTWIDGTLQYDHEEAAANHAEHMQLRGRLLAEASGGEEADSKSPENGKGEDMRRGSTRTTTDADRPDARGPRDRLLERVARGEDPTAIEAGDCGCAPDR